MTELPTPYYQEDGRTKLTAGMFTSRTEEWETPQYVFDALNTRFGFSLDVCATSENNKCRAYFDKERNGLVQDWAEIPQRWGRICFMNPPYGREIYKWMEKAYGESRHLNTVVCLVHARTDTRWWHDWAMKADEIWFVKGRLRFGDGKQSAPFPSCVIIFRPGTNPDAPSISSITFRR